MPHEPQLQSGTVVTQVQKRRNDMQGHRASALTIFAVLLVLAGCSGSAPPPQPATQQPAQPARATPPGASLTIEPGAKKLEVHNTGLPKDTVVTWSYILPFVIQFTDEVPCTDNPADPKLPNEFPSVGDTAPYTVSCKLGNAKTKKTRFPYEIYQRPKAGKLHKKYSSGSHCEGCFMETESW
jgi:hypothetical protein